MSRLVVENAIRAELVAFAAAYVPPFVFYDTVDQEQSINDDVWCSAEFYSDFTDRLCYSGAKKMESGNIDVTVFTKAGGGSEQAKQICDDLEDYFINVDMSEVEIIDTVSANEYTGGDAGGKYYGATVSLNYQYVY